MNSLKFTVKSHSLYRKPPTISPGLIYFRKRFLMGLYKGGGRGLYTGGAYAWTIFCVGNKQVGRKQVSHKQENKHVLSSVTGLILIRGTYIRGGGLYSGGGGGLYSGGGAYIRGGGLYLE